MLARVRAWRKACPDLTLRSTFIVGFPGETEAEFEELLDFLREAELDRVGAFAYSPPVDRSRPAVPLTGRTRTPTRGNQRSAHPAP